MIHGVALLCGVKPVVTTTLHVQFYNCCPPFTLFKYMLRWARHADRTVKERNVLNYLVKQPAGARGRNVNFVCLFSGSHCLGTLNSWVRLLIWLKLLIF